MIQRAYPTHKLNFYRIERSVLNCYPSMSSKDNLEETPALQAKVHKISEHRDLFLWEVLRNKTNLHYYWRPCIIHLDRLIIWYKYRLKWRSSLFCALLLSITKFVK